MTVERDPILVVEDDDLVQAFLVRALTGVVPRIEACATGAEAVRLAGEREYGAILLDGLLPDTHGIDLARTLLGMPTVARSGVCFVSGSLRLSSQLRAGVSALPKPLRVRDLVATVEELLAWRDGAVEPVAERVAAVNALSADLLVG